MNYREEEEGIGNGRRDRHWLDYIVTYEGLRRQTRKNKSIMSRVGQPLKTIRETAQKRSPKTWKQLSKVYICALLYCLAQGAHTNILRYPIYSYFMSFSLVHANHAILCSQLQSSFGSSKCFFPGTSHQMQLPLLQKGWRVHRHPGPTWNSGCWGRTWAQHVESCETIPNQPKSNCCC